MSEAPDPREVEDCPGAAVCDGLCDQHQVTAPIDYAELRALLEAGTPRPWEVENYPEAAGSMQVFSWAAGWPTIDRPLTESDADLIAAAVNALPALLDAAVERDAAVAELAAVRAAVEDERAGRLVAGEAADRFRDVLSECLGHADRNPGDDVLVDEVRAHFGKSGPEPRRWRDFLTGALATLDQINALPEPTRTTAAKDDA